MRGTQRHADAHWLAPIKDTDHHQMLAHEMCGEKLTFAGSLPLYLYGCLPCLWGYTGFSRNGQRTYEMREVLGRGWEFHGYKSLRILFLGRRLMDIIASTLPMRQVENMRPKLLPKIWQAPDTQIYVLFRSPQEARLPEGWEGIRSRD